MRVLILGHTGLLGNCLHKFLFGKKELDVHVTGKRWPNQDFVDYLRSESFDWVINGIAELPQSKPEASALFVTNVGLPAFLASLESKIVHPSSNDLSGDSPYSISKLSAEKILLGLSNTYIIRSSIIGIETKSNKSFLSWFLSNKGESINGFTNHFWNGITTLTWAGICWDLLQDRISDRLVVPYSDTVSKFELLLQFKEVFNKEIEIIPVENPLGFKEAMNTTLYTGNIRSQLSKLKSFYSSIPND